MEWVRTNSRISFSTQEQLPNLISLADRRTITGAQHLNAGKSAANATAVPQNTSQIENEILLCCRKPWKWLWSTLILWKFALSQPASVRGSLHPLTVSNTNRLRLRTLLATEPS